MDRRRSRSDLRGRQDPEGQGGRSPVLHRHAPRYEAFTHVVTALVKQGVRFRDLAGNDEILLTAIAPRDWDYRLATGGLLFSDEILTDPAAQRIAVRVPVSSLHVILADLPTRGVSVEHLYDY